MVKYYDKFKEVTIITEKFMKLDPKKRKIILDAAYKEFAEHGYEYASTNRIVKNAKISKGMLFYYFNSKKELFHYLISYGIDYIVNEYLNEIDENERDFIEKYRQMAKIKMKSYTENPHIFHFFGTIYINEFDELPEELKKQLLEARNLAYTKTYKNIDKSLLREDIDPDKIIRLINLTMLGYENELVNSLKGEKISSIDYSEYWKEYDEFLDLLKKVYYK